MLVIGGGVIRGFHADGGGRAGWRGAVQEGELESTDAKRFVSRIGDAKRFASRISGWGVC
jgi:hypothetical protein